MERVDECLQAVAHHSEPSESLGLAGDAVAVDAQLLACGLDFQTLVVEQILDHIDRVDVGRRVETRPAVVAFGREDGKLCLPEAQGRCHDSGHVHDFAYLIITFACRFFHSCAKVIRNWQISIPTLNLVKKCRSDLRKFKYFHKKSAYRKKTIKKVWYVSFLS